MTVAYCMKCKDKREMVKEKSVVTKNGRDASKGECKKCGTKMYRINGKSKKATKSTKKSKSKKGGKKSKKSKKSKSKKSKKGGKKSKKSKK